MDTKVDIWSLECPMYACFISKSPFEALLDEAKGSLSVFMLGGSWQWPGDGDKQATGKQRFTTGL